MSELPQLCPPIIEPEVYMAREPIRAMVPAPDPIIFDPEPKTLQLKLDLTLEQSFFSELVRENVKERFQPMSDLDMQLVSEAIAVVTKK